MKCTVSVEKGPLGYNVDRHYERQIVMVNGMPAIFEREDGIEISCNNDSRFPPSRLPPDTLTASPREDCGMSRVIIELSSKDVEEVAKELKVYNFMLLMQRSGIEVKVPEDTTQKGANS